MPAAPGLQKLVHHYLTQVALPFISNASPVETRPHFKTGSNVLSSLYGYLARRPGFDTDTAQTFTGTISRIFLWQKWNGDRYKMICTTSSVSGASNVWKLKIGTDTTYIPVLTDATTSTSFDFVVANNSVYMGNESIMRKWDGTTVTTWGIAKPAAAATSSSVASGSISAYNGGHRWRYAFGSSTSGHIGQVSDISTITGNYTSKNYTITGSTTTDAQVDRVYIYRTTDGGGTFFEHPSSPVTYSASWSLTDSTVDTALTTDQASLAAQNAPPTASRGSVYFASRIWTFAGDVVYFSNFEEQKNGVEEESFASINFFNFGRTVTGLATAQKTLLVFTASSVFRITGDSLTTFTRAPFLGRMGATSVANIAQGGARTVAWLDTAGTIYVTDGIGIEEIGLPIRSDLAGINQSTSSLTFHSNGTINWLIVQDSAQDKMWVYDLDNGIWNVPWNIGGTAAHSGETSTGVYTLLIARAFKPLKLTSTSYTDLGATYSASLTTGLMEMGEGKGPGEVANLEYIAVERNARALGDVLFLQDEDPASGTYSTVFTNRVDAPNRTQGTNLVEDWFYRTTTATTGRRISVKFDWPSEETEFKLFAIDTVTNLDESA